MEPLDVGVTLEDTTTVTVLPVLSPIVNVTDTGLNVIPPTDDWGVIITLVCVGNTAGVIVNT
jgi:hypothetical protein